MRVTIHQPVYLPYLGVLSKIKSSDIFIVYDTAQYEKGSVHNRQSIRNFGGSTLITIPLKTSLTPLNKTWISYENNNNKWYGSHWKTIELNYKKTPHFAKYKDELKELFFRGHPKTLGEFNLSLLFFLMRNFGIAKKVIRFSELNIDENLSASEKLATAVGKVSGTEYISGPSGKKYLDLLPFKKKGIDVSFFEFNHPVYPQYHQKFDNMFIKNMSALDALFNIGSMPEGPAMKATGEKISHALSPLPSSEDK